MLHIQFNHLHIVVSWNTLATSELSIETKNVVYVFPEMLNVSADILALSALRVEGAEEVSFIFYGNKSF